MERKNYSIKNSLFIYSCDNILSEVISKAQPEKLYIIKCKITATIAKRIASFIKENNSIKQLILNHNEINNKVFLILLECLPSNVRTLNLNFNKIGARGAKALSEKLATNNKLENLYLTDNNIGDKGIKYLLRCPKLMRLVVAKNNITYLKPSSSNSNLAFLDLSHNDIAQKTLANFLIKNEELISLTIDNIANPLYLVRALKINRSLKILYLKRSNLSLEICNKILDSKKIISELKTANLPNNKLFRAAALKNKIALKKVVYSFLLALHRKNSRLPPKY